MAGLHAANGDQRRRDERAPRITAWIDVAGLGQPSRPDHRLIDEVDLVLDRVERRVVDEKDCEIDERQRDENRKRGRAKRRLHLPGRGVRTRLTELVDAGLRRAALRQPHQHRAERQIDNCRLHRVTARETG